MCPKCGYKYIGIVDKQWDDRIHYRCLGFRCGYKWYHAKKTGEILDDD